MEREKHVDESWKDSVAQEKQKSPDEKSTASRIINEEPASSVSEEHDQAPLEVNFINYISSLVFQSMIFLGELPNPITNETEKNFAQAKFLIDTLVMIREKTTGNLTKAEENLLNSSVYELQLHYVDLIGKENQQVGS